MPFNIIFDWRKEFTFRFTLYYINWSNCCCDKRQSGWKVNVSRNYTLRKTRKNFETVFSWLKSSHWIDLRIRITKGVLHGVRSQCAPDRKSVCRVHINRSSLHQWWQCWKLQNRHSSDKRQRFYNMLNLTAWMNLSDERRMATMPLIRLDRTGKLQKQRGKLIFVLLIMIY